MAFSGDLNPNNDTIFALATPRGRAALSIVRISGPNTEEVLRGLLRDQNIPEVRLASLKKIYSVSGNLLDESIVLRFKSPKSFSGEDLAEIITHGNPLIVEQLMQDLVSRGTRLAKPGEFSRRAVEAGKMDLLDLEGLDQLIHARSPEALQIVAGSKTGGSKQSFLSLKSSLLAIQAQLEAHLDFIEEDLDPKELVSGLKRAIETCQDWERSFESNRRYLENQVVALVGRPNAGKSSLFNALVGENRAIVHESPGTTRDYIEFEVVSGGRSFLLVDTPGIRETIDPVERLGLERLGNILDRADWIYWLSEAFEEPPEDLKRRYSSKKWIFIATKADLRKSGASDGLWRRVSSLTKEGLGGFWDPVVGQLSEGRAVDGPLFSQRQLEAIGEARASLLSAIDNLAPGRSIELAGENLRLAIQSLSFLLGEVGHDELLKAILGRFCIGK